MQAVVELQRMGFELTTDGEKIRYRYTKEGNPDALRTEYMLQRLKGNKAAAIDYLMAAAKPLIRPRDEQITAMVETVRDQATAAGWKPEQLDELPRIIKMFPAISEIGTITRQGICLFQRWPDGSFRGGLTYYNNETDQPWLKRIGRN